MKNTIIGFSQEKLIQLKDNDKAIKIDCVDLVILDWFVFFTPNMQNININGKTYYWLSYSKMTKDLPFLDLSKRSFADRLKKMCELNILCFFLNKEQGNTTFYGFGNVYFELIEKVVADNCNLCSQNNKGYVVETTKGMQSKQQSQYIDNNIYTDNNVNDNNIKDNKENIIKEIFDYWNEKKIKVHRDIKSFEIKIKSALKEHSVEEIKLAIDHYKEILDDSNYFYKYKWTLNEFLGREKGYEEFLDNGNKWENYKLFKEKQKSYNPYKKEEISRETKYPELDDIGYYR